MAENKNGKITQVIGAVLDVKFEQNCLPDINEALKIPTRSGGTLVAEVAQHLGDDIVRCVARRPHLCPGRGENTGTYVQRPGRADR